MNDIQQKINEIFIKYFKSNPLRMRMQDIQNEVFELLRYTDTQNLKEEVGDVLCSLIQLCNEQGWEYEQCIQHTLDKIEKRKHQYLNMGRKKHVAILGGSFDPIHKGHVAVAKFVLRTLPSIDEVWLLPCYTHMFGKELTDGQDRLNMCSLAVQHDPRIKVSDYEIKNTLNGKTYDLVQKLINDQEYTDEYTFSWIIGQDNANNFDTWYNYNELKRLIRFIIVPRKGVKPNGTEWYLTRPHVYLNYETDIPEISSTIIRDILHDDNVKQSLMDRESVGAVVDSEVLEYIRDNELYR